MLLDWQHNLRQAVRAAKGQILGSEHIEYMHHARLVTAAIHAFGDDPRSVFFIEETAGAGRLPRPDLIILHPQLGVVAIENKGVPLDDIISVRNTTLKIMRSGVIKSEDPFGQAEKILLRLRDLMERRVPRDEAIFIHTAALPAIAREDFRNKLNADLPPETLFSDAVASPAALRRELLSLARRQMQKSGRSACLTLNAHRALLQVLQGNAVLFPPRPMRAELAAKAHLLGSQIEAVEAELKEPTDQQRDLGRADLRGSHHLFRGVVGSGKSIILAMNAANTLRLQAEEPGDLFQRPRTPKICVVCFNRTLVHYLRERITAHYRRIAWEQPDDDAMIVTHFEGLVHLLASAEPRLDSDLNFEHKRRRAAEMSAAFDNLPAAARDAVMFDAIYVDEAQDFLAEELQLLARLAHPDSSGGRTLILFYDNAQNIYGLMPPVWEKLGINIKGRTVFLDQCFRNTRQILNLAFNVLVGSFAPPGLRVATRQFADLNNLKQRELVRETAERIEVLFANRTGNAPAVRVFNSRDDELVAAAELIAHLINAEHVTPQDILVLYRRPHIFGGKLEAQLRKALGNSCKLHIVDGEHQPNKRLPLLRPNVLTVSTIASAKGYDAAVVILLGADDIPPDSQGRAAFYVAATRAKMTLHILGIKRAVGGLLSEITVAAGELFPLQNGISTDARQTAAIKTASAASLCSHCGSRRLHAQQQRDRFIFRCIDCTEATPIATRCRQCGGPANLHLTGSALLRQCAACEWSELLHTNTPLAAFEQ